MAEKKERVRIVQDVAGNVLEKASSGWNFTDVDNVQELQPFSIEQTFSFLESKIETDNLITVNERQVSITVEWNLGFKDTVYLAQHALKTLRSQIFARENVEDMIEMAKLGEPIMASVFTPEKRTRTPKKPTTIEEDCEALRLKMIKAGMPKAQVDRLMNLDS